MPNLFFFFALFFFFFFFTFALRYISHKIRKLRGIFNQLARNEDRARRACRRGGGGKKKLNSFADCESTCALNVPSTCRANKPAARSTQRCKAHLKLKGFPRDDPTLRRMHGICNTRANPCLYTYSIAFVPGKLRISTLRCALETVPRKNVNLILS